MNILKKRDTFEYYVFPVSFWTEVFVIIGGLTSFFFLILLFQIPILAEWELNKGWIGWFTRLFRDSIAIFLCALCWKGKKKNEKIFL